MIKTSGDTTLTERCDKLLNRSIRIYQDIFDHYQNLAKEVPDSVNDQMQQRLVTIDTLCAEVKSVDDGAAELITSLNSLPESTTQLLTTRDELLARVHEMNRTIVKKANKTKSLLLHEIKGMHSGRNALQGYGKTVDTVKRNIINGSF